MRLMHWMSVFALSLGVGSVQAQAPAAGPGARPAPFSTYESKKREANELAMSLVVSGITCTCARFAEDIRYVVNDIRPGGIRIMPMLGNGGFQNLNDVLFLKGVDMGVVDQDNLKLLKKKDPALYANLEERVQFITKLYNAEFHVVAREGFKVLTDLRGKRVNFNLKDSQTEVTANNVFAMLKIDVEKSSFDNEEAISKLKKGELDAMIVLTGAPQSALAKLKPEDKLHFVAIDESMPGIDLAPVYEDYLPAALTSKMYPGLIPEGQSVPTIANSALLAVYAWPEGSERYRRLQKFVSAFFGKIGQFADGARHPKWAELNLAAEVTGWKRFKPASEWLAGNQTAAADGTGPNPGMSAAFEQFVDSFNKAAGNGKPLSNQEKAALFTQFRAFLDQQQQQASAQPPVR